MAGIEIPLERCAQYAGECENSGVFSRTVVVQRRRRFAVRPECRRRRRVKGRVNAAAQVVGGRTDFGENAANRCDVKRFAAVRRRHHREFAIVEAEPLDRTSANAGRRDERLGRRA